jgi:hypothetical protein
MTPSFARREPASLSAMSESSKRSSRGKVRFYARNEFDPGVNFRQANIMAPAVLV